MKRHLPKILSALLLALLWGGPALAEPAESKPFPQELSLISCSQIKVPLDFCGEAVPLNNPDVRERLDRELLTSLWNRPQVILWIKRSGRYMPVIEEVLAQNGMPGDLKYLVIVESALKPHSGSPKGAMGFWQFMEETGRHYGLAVNNGIDERRNIFSSTAAAVRYLKKLHADFGSWTLAAAAYNMGEEGLKAEMLVQKVTDYYQLYLPLETQQYLPRIITAKLILANPERYGFVLSKDDLYPSLEFDRIEIVCDVDIPVSLIAQTAHTSFKAIKDMNPEIRGYYLAKGRRTLLVPKGAADGFPGRYEIAYRQWQQDLKDHTYEVRKGDTLSSIAERFHVPLPALLIWNRLDHKKSIVPGDRLIIYPREEKPSLPDAK